MLHQRYPFNRTSMESKLYHSCESGMHDGLLIEPVWNRNGRSGIAFDGTYFLLIEPVWNRNQSAHFLRPQHQKTFNRTSMESKLGWYFGTLWRRRLLIEPVWNRNIRSHLTFWRPSFRLLIEPVWNRNRRTPQGVWYCDVTFNRTSMESKRLKYHRNSKRYSLLIEPVWNRNTIRDTWMSAHRNPFNRTSMESKHRNEAPKNVSA